MIIELYVCNLPVLKPSNCQEYLTHGTVKKDTKKYTAFFWLENRGKG